MGDDNSTTRTTTSAQPPQIMPEGREGYLASNRFYQGQLDAPDVYQGQRYAPATDTQREALHQAAATMGSGGLGYRISAGNELNKTLGGDYLNGPAAQEAVGGLAQPIFERFENQTMPGIRDASQAATGGMGGSRRTVANRNATQELGYNIGRGAVAPIFEGERGRMTREAIEGSQGLAGQDIQRTNALQSMGEAERKLSELGINAARDAYEEALSRREAGASSLASMATVGPGGSSSAYEPSGMRMFLGSSKA